MFGNKNADELDNLWNAYMCNGELEYSKNFKVIQNEFNNFFELLVDRKVISKSKYLEFDEKLGDIICEVGNQAFRQGFTKGLDLRRAVITVIEGG